MGKNAFPIHKNKDRHISLYMLDIGINDSRPKLRINVNVIPPIEPKNSFNNDNDSIVNKSLGDNSMEILGDHLMNVENQLINAEDPDPFNVMFIDKGEYPLTSIFNLIAKRFRELFRERHAYILK